MFTCPLVSSVTHFCKYSHHLGLCSDALSFVSSCGACAEYIVRGGKFKKMLGNWNYERTVVIKFPSFQRALDWYNSEEYEPIKQIRLDNSVSNGIIIKGV